MEIFNIVPLNRNIPLFLKLVKSEAEKILKGHSIPVVPGKLHNREIVEALTKKKMIDLVREAPKGKFAYTLPFDIYQAKTIYCLADSAEWCSSVEEQDGYAYATAEIVRIMQLSLSPSVIGRKGGKKNKGREDAITRFFKESIKKTASEIPEFSHEDVLNTIKVYRNSEIEIEQINESNGKVISIEYYDIAKQQIKTIPAKTISNKISKLR